MINYFAASTNASSSSLNKQRQSVLEDPYDKTGWKNLLEISRTVTDLNEFQELLERIFVELNSTLDIENNAEDTESGEKKNEKSSLHTEVVQRNRSLNNTCGMIPWQRSNLSEAKLRPLEMFDYDCSYLSPFLANVYGRECWESGWYRWVGPDPALVLHLPLNTEKQNWHLNVEFHSFYDQEDSNTLKLLVNDRMLPIQWVRDTEYEANIGSVDKERALTTIRLAIARSHQPKEGGDQRQLAFSIRRLSLY